MNRLSSKEEKIIADLYQEILNEDMDAGGMLGGVPTHNDLENGDEYATGDNRRPFLLGKGTIQTRKGAVKNRKKAKKVKKTLDFLK
jgi:hypothetical protein